MKFIVTGDALFSSRNVDKTMDPNLLALLKEADEVFTNAEFITPRKNTAPARAEDIRRVYVPGRWMSLHG
ncbi:hypothetical protein [Paenibacillus sp. AN1007]|uniref:Uncharacterized protein n=1 Tax=Paenibacillus sp. AN1007 TaxID=3151385 RepID=A0AAU8NEW0_9BACL